MGTLSRPSCRAVTSRCGTGRASANGASGAASIGVMSWPYPLLAPLLGQGRPACSCWCFLVRAGEGVRDRLGAAVRGVPAVDRDLRAIEVRRAVRQREDDHVAHFIGPSLAARERLLHAGLNER